MRRLFYQLPVFSSDNGKWAKITSGLYIFFLCTQFQTFHCAEFYIKIRLH
jgi:hypothetical protein